MNFGCVVVCLGLNGDVINSLGCIKHLAETQGPCGVVIKPEFAPILEGVSYATPILFDGSIMDTWGASALAYQHCDRVLVARICERGENQCESFAQESYRQLGLLHLWNELPLVFDRRSAPRENELLKNFTSVDRGNPYGLYNVMGKSSPVPNGEAWMQRNKDRICSGLDWIDLSTIKAHRIYDLLGLMDKAKVLVTGDTATLHLAAASRVPTINLLQFLPSKWHGSKPRNNSIACWRYNEMPEIVPEGLLKR